MKLTVCVPNLHGTTHGCTFEVHVEGCKDLQRGPLRNALKSPTEADSQVAVCDDIYPPSDFECQSGEYLYDIHFAPCCKDLKEK